MKPHTISADSKTEIISFSGSHPLTCRHRLPGIFLVTQVANQNRDNNTQRETEAGCQAYDDFYKLKDQALVYFDEGSLRNAEAIQGKLP